MSSLRVLRAAWAGTLVGVGSGLGYLAFAPVPGSFAVDRILAVAIATGGVVIGIAVESALERRFASAGSTGLPADTRSREHLPA